MNIPTKSEHASTTTKKSIDALFVAAMRHLRLTDEQKEQWIIIDSLWEKYQTKIRKGIFLSIAYTAMGELATITGGNIGAIVNNRIRDYLRKERMERKRNKVLSEIPVFDTYTDAAERKDIIEVVVRHNELWGKIATMVDHKWRCADIQQELSITYRQYNRIAHRINEYVKTITN